MSHPSPKTSKGDQTRDTILESALLLFREKGYEKTTMRGIAEHADVSLGNAYYYFRSKEHLVQGLYEQIADEHLSASEPILRDEREFQKRLLGVMNALLTVIEPHHRFSEILFTYAADPRSPMNPFSDESEEMRKRGIAFYEHVIAECRIRIPDDLKSELPLMLWMYHMSIVLYWIHDVSPSRRKTRKLVARTVELISRLVSIASLPLMRPLRRKAVELLVDLRNDDLKGGG